MVKAPGVISELDRHFHPNTYECYCSSHTLNRSIPATINKERKTWKFCEPRLTYLGLHRDLPGTLNSSLGKIEDGTGKEVNVAIGDVIVLPAEDGTFIVAKLR